MRPVVRFAPRAVGRIVGVLFALGSLGMLPAPCLVGGASAQLLPGLSTSGDSSASSGEQASTAGSEQQLAEARSQLEAVEAQIAALNDMVRDAESRTGELRAEIADGEDLAGLAQIDLETMDRAGIEELIATQRELIAGHRERIVELDSLLSTLIRDPGQLGREPGAARSETPSSPQGAATPAAAADSASGDGAVDAGAELQSIRREIADRRAELATIRVANNERLNALATAQREYERRVLAEREAFVERAGDRLRRLREAEASRSVDEARRAQMQTAFEPTVVRELVDEIVSLKEELAGASRQAGAASDRLQDVSSLLSRTRDDFVTTRERVQVVGSTPAIGRMLRRRLAGLPSMTGYRRDASARRGEISAAIDRQIDIDEDLRDLGNVDVELERLMAGVGDPVADDERERLGARLRELLVEKRNTLGELHAQYGAVAARLTQLDQAQRSLVEEAREYVAFIESKLMTIPGQAPLHAVGAGAWVAAVESLFGVQLWADLAAISLTALSRHVPLVLFVLLAAGVLFAAGRWAREELRRIAPLTRRIRTDRMALTFVALGCTLLLSSVLPTLLIGTGWILHRAAVSDLSAALGGALVRAGLWVLVLEFLREMVRADGLAMRHFRWTEDTCRRIGRHLVWFLPLAPVLTAANRFAFDAGVPGLDLASRLLFIATLATIFLFLLRILRHRPARERFPDALTELSDPLAHKRSRWFLPLAVLIAADALLSYFGYHYAAMSLDVYFGWTIVLLIVLMVVHNLLLRWSTLVQRRLRFNELVKRREELRASRDAGDSESGESGEFQVAEEEELDVVGLGEQTRRLVSAALVFSGLAGLYLVWDDLFPALRVLDEITLPFTHLEVVDGEEARVPVTLTDLGVALLVFAATFIGARNLPGLLEFVVLQRLPIDAGARYATITIARYLIVAIGVIVGFGIIGADWSKLQWLVAALGVGLGFGLQEIVANFISGIILLFERPIRVGDIITLGDTDGVVTRIRIRATTIRNWDQRELIVPNKEFITGRLLNWTLSDPVNRMVINVGVAYGSDTDKALAIMLDAGQKHPEVLEDPQPVVVFEGFGESSLNLSLRCYLSGLDARLQTMNDLHREINRRFTAAGIKIPFVQRDVHLKAGDPLEVILRRDRSQDPGQSG